MMIIFVLSFFLVVDTAVDGSRAGSAGRLVLQAARNNGYNTETGSPTTTAAGSAQSSTVSRQQLHQLQQQQPPTTTTTTTSSSSPISSEPPRTLLRGILSQQPGASVPGLVANNNNNSAVLGLVNLHSILQPGHPALRPAGPADHHQQQQQQPGPYHHHHLNLHQQQQLLRHPSLVPAHHPHVKPGTLSFLLFSASSSSLADGIRSHTHTHIKGRGWWILLARVKMTNCSWPPTKRQRLDIRTNWPPLKLNNINLTVSRLLFWGAKWRWYVWVGHTWGQTLWQTRGQNVDGSQRRVTSWSCFSLFPRHFPRKVGKGELLCPSEIRHKHSHRAGYISLFVLTNSLLYYTTLCTILLLLLLDGETVWCERRSYWGGGDSWASWAMMS